MRANRHIGSTNVVGVVHPMIENGQARLPERAPLRTEELFEALRARILSDEWPAGSRLPAERELAELYDTNRNTLREAIRRLQQAGLVTVRQGQGVTISDFRATGSLDLAAPFIAFGRDLREKAQIILDLLEPRKRGLEYAVERFIERASPEDLATAEDAIREIRAAEALRDAQALTAAEGDFYEAVVEASHDQIVRWMSRPLLDLNRDIQTRWPGIVVFEPSLSQLASRLLSAAVARDQALARTLLRSHYDAIDRSVRAMLSPHVDETRGATTP
jgi:DNA-binding FadR family transcriptional regulator